MIPGMMVLSRPFSIPGRSSLSFSVRRERRVAHRRTSEIPIRNPSILSGRYVFILISSAASVVKVPAVPTNRRNPRRLHPRVPATIRSVRNQARFRSSAGSGGSDIRKKPRRTTTPIGRLTESVPLGPAMNSVLPPPMSMTRAPPRVFPTAPSQVRRASSRAEMISTETPAFAAAARNSSRLDASRRPAVPHARYRATPSAAPSPPHTPPRGAPAPAPPPPPPPPGGGRGGGGGRDPPPPENGTQSVPLPCGDEHPHGVRPDVNRRQGSHPGLHPSRLPEKMSLPPPAPVPR